MQRLHLISMVVGIVFLCSLIVFPHAAHAYIGPGLGAGAVAVVVGVLASIGLALIAILWYPLKRLFKKIRGSNNKSEDLNSEQKK